MSNKTADTMPYETRPRAGVRSYVIDDGVTLFAHSLVGVDASGFLDKWANTAAHEFQGLLIDGDRHAGTLQSDGTYSITGDSTPAAGRTAPEGHVDVSGLTLLSVPVNSAVQGSVNALVYCATDNPADFVLTATANVRAVGWVSRFVSAGVCDVTLFTPEEFLAQNDLAAIAPLTENSTSIGGTQDDNFASLAVAWDGSTDPTAAEGALLIDAIRECAAKINELIAR